MRSPIFPYPHQYFLLSLSFFFLIFYYVAAHRLPLVAASEGYFLAAVCGLLTAMASPVVERGL